MDYFQIIAIFLIAIFYISYFMKMLLQRKQGIKTDQIARGDKPVSTQRVEQFMRVATLAIVPVELGSIIVDTHKLQSQIFTAIGLAVAMVGVLCFVIAMVTMKNSWRAGINSAEKTTLIKSGIYRISRNPAFLGFDLMYIGIFIAYANVVHFIFMAFAMVMLHFQILEEEKFLPTVFGKEYLDYKRKAARYFLFL